MRTIQDSEVTLTKVFAYVTKTNAGKNLHFFVVWKLIVVWIRGKFAATLTFHQMTINQGINCHFLNEMNTLGIAPDF